MKWTHMIWDTVDALTGWMSMWGSALPIVSKPSIFEKFCVKQIS